MDNLVENNDWSELSHCKQTLDANSLDVQATSDDISVENESSKRSSEKGSIAAQFAANSQQISETLASLVRTLTKTISMLMVEGSVQAGRCNMKTAVQHLLRHQQNISTAMLAHIQSLENTSDEQRQELEALQLETEALRSKITLMQEMTDSNTVNSITATNTDSPFTGKDRSLSSPKHLLAKVGQPNIDFSSQPQSIPFEISVEQDQ